MAWLSVKDVPWPCPLAFFPPFPFPFRFPEPFSTYRASVATTRRPLKPTGRLVSTSELDSDGVISAGYSTPDGGVTKKL